MIYDVLSGETYNDGERTSFFTIGDLIQACIDNPNVPVRFLETQYTVGELISWRGSYDIPCITYDSGKDKLGYEVASELEAALKEKHYGYKGGEYIYYDNDEFYVSRYAYSEEFKVVKAVVEDGFLVLYTKKAPY